MLLLANVMGISYIRKKNLGASRQLYWDEINFFLNNYKNMIQWLQDWYSSNCDGDWEHDYGVTIETIDNPGWSIKIDVVAVDFTLANKGWKLFELSEENWLGYKIEHHVFYASGDAHKLESLIMIFKILVEKGQIEDAYIYEHFL